eukprot:gene17876-19655_t
MADYIQIALLLKSMLLLACLYNQNVYTSRLKRMQQRKQAATKRIEKYMRLRRRKTKSSLTNLLGALYHPLPLPVERAIWCKSRSGNWWESIVLNCFTDQDWLKNFRMKKATFVFICEQLRPYLQKEDSNMRKAIPVEKRLAIALWRLATGSYYNTIGHLFGISEASACRICDEVCSLVATKLLPRFIKFPEGAELDEVIEDFEKRWGFPQCAAAIDGSHIPIKAPIEYHADFYNRKGWYSVILQGLVDSKYRFKDINVGWPGKVHDARVFANSHVYEKGVNRTLFPASKSKNINGIKVPVFIIGDAAYPLLSWVMKPFADNGNLSDEKAHFNYRLSRARMVVENAFGCLKGRWRCLLKQNEADYSKINEVVATCCTLHNICETFNEVFDGELTQGVDGSAERICTAEPHQANTVNLNADAIRNALVNYCQDNPI